MVLHPEKGKVVEYKDWSTLCGSHSWYSWVPLHIPPMQAFYDAR